MYRNIKIVLAALVVLGSASLARADDPAIDQAADAMRNYGPVVQQKLQTRNVALPKTHTIHTDAWMDRASQNSGF